MNSVSLNNLWIYLKGLSLTASNQRWLGKRLLEASESNELDSVECEKLNKLNALFGIWADNDDGEKIEQAVKEARNAEYDREIVSLDE